jgi:hypothetical protein
MRKGPKNFKTVVSDIDKAKLIEVINGHNTEAIIEKLMEQPIEIREAVEEVSTESLPQRVLSGATLVPLVRVNIKVERVGFTRNASRTPYIVYKVGNPRCSTFIKRQVFIELVQVLLKLRCGIWERVKSITSAYADSLSVDTTKGNKFIPRPYVNKFFERYNQVALERIVPQPCECNDLFDMCLHSISSAVAEFFEF